MTGERWTPGEIRDFLAENVTVVAPGETLVIRAWDDWTPNQVAELTRALNVGWDEGDPWLPFRVVVVPGAELGKVAAPEVTKPESDEQFAARVARVINSDAVRLAVLKMIRRDGAGQRNPAVPR